jgi:transposase
MSVKPVDSQRSFYHTDYLCADLFGPASRYRLFREKILPKLFTLRPKLESFYCEDNGRPAVDPVMLCGVTLLQFMEKVADRGASEHVVYHLGWKYALDLELDYQGFHSTVLVYFRDRLEQKEAERMIFDGVVKLLMELGLVKRKGKQRLDSTHVVGYVKAMSWLECALETLRLGLEDLEAEVGRKKRPEFWERLWGLYVQSQLDWRLSQTEHNSRYRQCGQDMRELLEWIDRNDPRLNEREAVKSFSPLKGGGPARYRTRMIPMLITPIRGPSSGSATRCTWWRVSIQNSRSRKKASPPSILLPRY